MTPATLRTRIRRSEAEASAALQIAPVKLGDPALGARDDLVRESIQLARRLLTLARMANDGDVINLDGYAVQDAGKIDSLIAVLRVLESKEGAR